jgi:hypothetical protein
MLRAAGAATLLLMGGFVMIMRRKSRNRKA